MARNAGSNKPAQTSSASERMRTYIDSYSQGAPSTRKPARSMPAPGSYRSGSSGRNAPFVQTPELDAAVGNTPEFVAPSTQTPDFTAPSTQTAASPSPWSIGQTGQMTKRMTEEEYNKRRTELEQKISDLEAEYDTVAMTGSEPLKDVADQISATRDELNALQREVGAEETREPLHGLMSDLDYYLFDGGALLAAESALENTASATAEAARAVWDFLSTNQPAVDAMMPGMTGAIGLPMNTDIPSPQPTEEHVDPVSAYLAGFADVHAEAAEDAMGIAKENMPGTVGGILLDATAAGTQMVGDIVIGAATGGSATIPMLVRSFGSGVQDARNKGYTQEQQLALGLTSAATEYITEKFFGGNPFYDTAQAGLVNRAIKWLGGNEQLLSILSSTPVETLNEGLEEILSGVINPAMEYIIAGQADPIVLEELLKEGLIGVALGGAGQVASSAFGGQQPAETTTGTTTTEETSEPPSPLIVEEQQDTDPLKGLTPGTRSHAEAVLASQELRAQFEKESGVKLSGTKAEQRNAILEYYRNRQEAEEPVSPLIVEEQTTQPAEPVGPLVVEEQEREAHAESRVTPEELADMLRGEPLFHEKAKPVSVGRATTIQNPYTGETPTQTFTRQAPTEISAEQLQQAQAIYRQAESQSQSEGTNFKTALSRLYAHFKGPKGIAVEGMVFNGREYRVNVSNGLPGKLISQGSDINTFAVLDSLENIIRTGEYVGSGSAQTDSGPGKKSITRYDYFESDVTIDGQPYVVRWDAEIVPGNNKYKTHRVVNMQIDPVGEAGRTGSIGQDPSTTESIAGQQADTASVPNSTIPQNGPTVNSGAEAQTPPPPVVNGSGPYHPINEQGAASAKATHGRDPVQVPVTNFEGHLTSKTASTVINSGLTPNGVAQSLSDLLNRGALSRIPFSDAEATARARQTIEKKGFAKAVEYFRTEVESGKRGKALSALGIELFNQAAQNNDVMTAADIATDIIESSREQAQAVQVLNLFNKATPEGRVYFAVKGVDNLISRMEAKYGDRAKDVAVDAGLLSEYYEAVRSGNEQATKEAWQEVQKDIAAQIPPSWADRLRAWRYLAMLGNPKTHIRNTAGNVAFMPFRYAKNVIGAGLEAASGTDGRTKSVLNPLNAQDRQLMQLAWQDYAAAMDGSDTGKYDESTSEIDRMRRVLPGALDDVAKLNTELMALEDRWFSQPAYMDALAGWFKANKITPQQVADMMAGKDGASVRASTSLRELGAGETVRATDRDNFGKIVKNNGDGTYLVHFVSETEHEADVNLPRTNLVPTKGKNGTKSFDVSEATPAEIFAEARAYAIREAKKATFQDSNAFSDAVSKLGRSSKGVRWFADAVLPFKRTPANVLMRAVEYSPAYLVRGIGEMAFGVRSGKISAAEAIDHLASGMTGSVVMGLGVLLAHLGLLRASGDDDDKQAAFDKLQGKQDYALTVGDTSITLDWMSPMALPLFVGAELYDLMSREGPDSATAEDYFSAALGIVDPILETTMLSGVNDTINSVGYSDAGLVSIAKNVAFNYLGSFLPTFGGQVERVFDKTRQETYRQNDSKLFSDSQHEIGGMLNKVPGVDYGQIDYVDAWGRTQDYDSLGANIFNQFINPSYVSRERTSEVETELQRLYDEGNGNVFPTRRSQSDTINIYDEDGNFVEERHLTADEYVQYNTTKGQTSLELVSQLMDSDAYEKMDDAARAEAIARMYEYANAIATLEVSPNTNVDSWVTKAMDADDTAKYLQVYSAYGYASDDNHMDHDMLDGAVAEYGDLSEDDQKALADGNRLDDLYAASQVGIDSEAWYKAYDKWDELSDTKKDGYSATDKATDFARWVDTAGFTPEQAEVIRGQLTFHSGFTAQTTRYDDMRSADIGADAAHQIYQSVDSIKVPEGESVKAWQQYEAVARSGASEADIDKAMIVYMGGYPEPGETNNTITRYEQMRAAGFTPVQFAAIYQAYSQREGSNTREKRADFINRMSRYGESWAAAAPTLWEYFTANKTALAKWEW